MEKLKRIVSEIAYSHDFPKLPLLHRSFIPLLSMLSSLYYLSVTTSHHLYFLGIFRKKRLPVPVISVGNLTWGGNGKTPMVEFLSNWFSNSGISPLILSRGYAGGDEVKMLERHLLGTSAKVGVGANRALSATLFLEKYGYTDSRVNGFFENLLLVNKVGTNVPSDKIGVAILDDGMQHVCLVRDLDIVMVNGMMPWGNNELIPLGPLREPLSSLARADIVVIHHADLVSEQKLIHLRLGIQEIKNSLPVFFSSMVPSHFFTVYDVGTKLPLSAVKNRVLLCLSAIGSPNGFVKCVEKLGPSYVDQLHYSDHYLFHSKDIYVMTRKLEELYHKFGSRPIVVTTEKDYDRDSEILSQLHPFDVLVLCSQLQLVSYSGSSENKFKELLKQLLDSRSGRLKKK
ncbi:probable tetraacyldisaccharide 4'-kinase, mitochondrial [Chenopodium quinoa]|uniref:probable tetraacyldisaccharide 4'-kinase, mitochondrial n=1 Tax=Chenopodium quinoa TaxID=63459 RepID=UPI000B78CEA3|nr:probable tetraacyldisaccharide 4'-kinase, mitochondrial [Chenopodium quinoa]